MKSGQLYKLSKKFMTTLNDILGMTVVGYRFGKAPESGRSYNFRDGFYEDGVSMAKVLYCKQVGSFAAAGQKKFYYKGVVSGTGSDNEICITNVIPITYKEYLELRKTMISESNAITNYYADQKIRLLNKGYNIGCTEEDIENYRKKFLKNTNKS